MNSRLVITGTDTGIGKTVFSAALTDALGASYWKPVQSGLDEESDSDLVARLGRIPAQRILPEAWRLKTPVSPHQAAEIDGVTIDVQALEPPATDLSLIIEGAGGLLVPLTRHETFADLFARWRIPVVLCARTSLGTINHTLLSLGAMRQRGIPVAGVAFIGDEYAETQRIIAEMGQARIFGRLPRLEALTPDTLRQAFRENFEASDFREVMG